MNASKRVLEIIEQKYKYWLKTLSQTAIDSNFLTFADLSDTLRFFGSIYISDTVFSSLLSSIMLGIPPIEIIPLSLTWRVELPTVEEFLKGSLIKLVKEDLTLQFPELQSLFFTFYGVLQPDVAETVYSEIVEKGVYGVSRYDKSYYDPTAMGMFLRSTMYSVTKRDLSEERKLAEIKSLAKALNLNDELVRYLFNSLQFTTYLKERASAFDYAWFDFSSFPEESSEPVVSITDYDGETRRLEYLSLVDASGGSWFDNAIFDYTMFMSDETPTIYIEERKGNLITEIAERIIFSFNSRVTTTSLALGNYQTGDERAEYRGTGRVDTYAVPRVFLEGVRRTVLTIVESVESSRYIQNLYVDAAFNLISILTKPGGWGNESQRLMSRDEAYTYFIEKWTKRGLKKEILDKIFSLIYNRNYINILRKRRYDETEYLKVSRGGG